MECLYECVMMSRSVCTPRMFVCMFVQNKTDDLRGSYKRRVGLMGLQFLIMYARPRRSYIVWTIYARSLYDACYKLNRTRNRANEQRRFFRRGLTTDAKHMTPLHQYGRKCGPKHHLHIFKENTYYRLCRFFKCNIFEWIGVI